MRKGAIALVAANLAIVAGAVSWAGGRSASPAAAPPAVSGWEALGPQARCDQAAALVRRSITWPIVCRWREAGDALRGQSYPPPVGEPPWDHPRIEVYVGRTEAVTDVGHVIAHEMGHMTHTRTATFGSRWLAVRGLPAETPPSVWTEDYAEVFATLYGPPFTGWQASTTPPSPAELGALESEFFASP